MFMFSSCAFCYGEEKLIRIKKTSTRQNFWHVLYYQNFRIYFEELFANQYGGLIFQVRGTFHNSEKQYNCTEVNCFHRFSKNASLASSGVCIILF